MSTPDHHAWTHTSRGRAFDLLSPSPVDVDVEEVARALGFLCRYAGGVSRYYSVAEHSVLICDWLLQETGDEVLALAGEDATVCASGRRLSMASYLATAPDGDVDSLLLDLRLLAALEQDETFQELERKRRAALGLP